MKIANTAKLILRPKGVYKFQDVLKNEVNSKTPVMKSSKKFSIMNQIK